MWGSWIQDGSCPPVLTDLVVPIVYSTRSDVWGGVVLAIKCLGKFDSIWLHVTLLQILHYCEFGRDFAGC